MMSCITTSTVCLPNASIGRRCALLSQPVRCQTSWLYTPSINDIQYKKPSLGAIYGKGMCKGCAPVCVFGDKGKQERGNEGFSWDSLKKAMEGLQKEKTMQDLLRERMQEQEIGGNGGDGNFPSGDGGDSGSSDDGGFAAIWDELLQVILATIGFIFVYIYMIRGEEMIRLARDYIKYLFGAKTSVRLRRAMYKWKKFYENITRKEVVRQDWLERTIVATPTWWNKPKKLAQMMRSND